METQKMKLTKRNLKNSLPLDLMMDVLKRLPVKTLIRFLSVSKHWTSIIQSRDFMKLFMNLSLTKPRGLIFLFQHQGFDFSSALLQNTNELSSLTTHTATGQLTTVAPSVHGLICYGHSTRLVIYNPFTRRSINLREINTWRRPINYYLGHDPINNDYNVLCIMTGWNGLVKEIQVLTVGPGNSWKKIENIIIPHSPFGQELCMSGVLYYQALTGTKMDDSAIISFDVRSEKLYPYKVPFSFWHRSSKLTSYEGKLAVIFYGKNFSGGFIIAFCVLEDAGKEEWSNKTFVLSLTILPVRWLGNFHTTETDKGVIIFAPTNLPASLFSLIYFDMKTNSTRTVDIQGTTECMGYSKSVSYNLVDNLMCL